MAVPKKSFGQHFLRDASVIQKIVHAAEPEKFPVVVEVGPGEGAVTRGIEEARDERRETREGSSILIEADRDLLPHLEREFPKTTIVFADAAQINYSSLDTRLSSLPWLFVGNLPYNAANAIVMNALTSPCPPSRMVIMVQKEVGERMLGLAGSRGVLSVAVGLYAQVERLFIVKPGSFSPPPKVDSMVLRLTPYTLHPTPYTPERVIALAKAGFASRRKQLVNNLVAAGIADEPTVLAALAALGLNAKIRAEELSVEQWTALAQEFFHQ